MLYLCAVSFMCVRITILSITYKLGIQYCHIPFRKKFLLHMFIQMMSSAYKSIAIYVANIYIRKKINLLTVTLFYHGKHMSGNKSK